MVGFMLLEHFLHFEHVPFLMNGEYLAPKVPWYYNHSPKAVDESRRVLFAYFWTQVVARVSGCIIFEPASAHNDKSNHMAVSANEGRYRKPNSSITLTWNLKGPYFWNPYVHGLRKSRPYTLNCVDWADCQVRPRKNL